MNKKEKEAFEDRMIGTTEFAEYIPPKDVDQQEGGDDV